MNKVEKSVSYHNSGFNCSQSILIAFGIDYGLSEDMAFKIACGFGAGMGRMQGACGAVTGAIMVIGLKYGMSRIDETHLKELTYNKVREFSGLFNKRNKSIICRDLLGVDITTPEGLHQARDLGLFNKLCNKYIQDAVEILEKIL